jgi:membrane-associated phospholipid phosphatase
VKAEATAASAADGIRTSRLLDLPRLVVILALLFVVLAILVDTGALTGIDQWVVDHAMPALRPRSEHRSVGSTLFPIFHQGRATNVALAATTYGFAWIASIIPSLLLTAGGCAYLWRRGRLRPAVRVAFAFVAVNAIEIAAKTLIDRPALFGTDPRGVRVRVQPFDTSFPSGHAARAVLLVALVGVLAPRLRLLGLAWLAAVLVLLVVGSWHTPSDVLGAVLLAGAFSVSAFGGRSYRSRSAPQPASRPARSLQRSSIASPK